MRAFVIRAGFFAILLLGVLFCIKSSVPYSWGNPEMHQKIEYLSENSTHYDCLFFGSSQVFRHIKPVLFDSLTSLKSYNLGSPNTFFVEVHYLVEHFLKNTASDEKIKIFLVNKAPTGIADRHFHTVRMKYFFDLKRLKIGIQKFRKKDKIFQLLQNYRYLVSFIENKLCIGELRAIKDFHLGNLKKLPNIVIEQQHGFYSLEQKLRFKKDNKLLKRNQKYLKSEVTKQNKPVSEHDKKMNIQQFSADELGINTYGKQIEFFYIKPIDLEVEFHFDRTHFNDKGAEMYTKKLAAIVREIL